MLLLTVPAAGQDNGAATAVDSTGYAKLQAALGQPSRTLTSTHFVIVYPAAIPPPTELLADLEAGFAGTARFAATCGVGERVDNLKLPVLYFADEAPFRAYLTRAGAADPRTLGCYDWGARCAVFFDLHTNHDVRAVAAELNKLPAAEQPAAQRRLVARVAQLARQIVRHEAAHQAAHALGLIPDVARVPAWFVEGLATQCEAPDVAEGRSNEPHARAAEFGTLYGAADCDLGGALRRVLFAADGWAGEGDYPLAWAIVAYLEQSQPAEWAAYSRAVTRRDDRVQTAAQRQTLFERHFGRVDDAWVTRLRNWACAATKPAESPASQPTQGVGAARPGA